MIEQAFNSFFIKSTKNYVNIHEQKKQGINVHFYHIEELILTEQERGLQVAIEFINELVKVFEGNVDSKVFTTVKYDGAPALICGYNPENGKFFVATKSAANVVPKVNYTLQDIQQNHGQAPGLAEKLRLALLYLPKVVKTGVYQAEFMFSKSDLHTITHEGKELLAFKPNTITYAVETDSQLGQKIQNAEIGIIFHTRYTGPLGNFVSSPNVSIEEFNQTPEVVIDDAKFKDVSGTVTLTNEEKDFINSNLNSVIESGKNTDWKTFSTDFYKFINTFINNLIRRGRFVDDPDKNFSELLDVYSTLMDKDIEKLKTEKGKQKKTEIKEENIKHYTKNKISLVNIFNITKKIAEIKNIFIKKYNTAINTKQFIALPDGTLKVTEPEGYVAVDHLGNVVKLVDRLEFSKANFSIPKEFKFKK
jgi:hypothetical protein